MALTKVRGDGLGTINTADLDGAVTINESSADVNFRVESNGLTNALFVDAGNDAVGINSSVADSGRRLHIEDGGTACGITFKDTAGTQFGIVNDGNAIIIKNDSGGRQAVRIDNSENVIFGQQTSASLTNTNSDEKFVVTSDGDIFLQGAAKILMTFNRNQTAGEIISIKQENTAVGGIDANSSSVDFNTSSDYRLKENVTTSWDATTRLKQLKPVRFSWKKEGKSEADTDGFLAHEVSSVVPQATKGTKDEVVTQKGIDDGIYPKDAKVGDAHMQSIDHSKLVPLLVKTIQELEARIATLESK